MNYALDSNILVSLANVGSDHYPHSVSATTNLASRGNRLIVFPQNLVEFWAVATRPISANGLGFTPVQAEAEIDRIRTIFQLIPESSQIYPEWQKLVVEYGVSGKNVHDARIVAQMRVNNIDDILTFNGKDFRRYRSTNVIDPERV